MVNMVKESGEIQMQDTSMTSRELLQKPENEIKWEEFKPHKRSWKIGDRRMRWQEFLKRIRCLLACCNSQIIVENSQLDRKPPENEQGGATEGTTL